MSKWLRWWWRDVRATVWFYLAQREYYRYLRDARRIRDRGRAS